MREAKLFFGGSVRAEHGGSPGLPIFGRYAARVSEDYVRLLECEGNHFVSLPLGSSMGGEDEAEALGSYERYVAGCTPGSNRDGWTTDRSLAVSAAINHAKARHEAKMLTSAAYRAKYGAIIPE